MDNLINTPFNYTGSKFKLLPQLLDKFDYQKDTFVDLFCGGGSVYTNIIDKYQQVIVNDIIKELMGIHYHLVNNPEKIIGATKNLCVSKDDKEGYLALRDSFNSEKTPPKLWALMLSCTNNMMRFNKKFGFNQSFGKRGWNSNTDSKVGKFVEHISKYSDKITFKSQNFNDISIPQSSMVYIDPPYTNTEAGYNAYWSLDLEHQLYKKIHQINKQGNSFMLSGVWGEHKNGEKSKIIYQLIEDGFNYNFLEYNYNKVSRKGNKNSKEIIIYNY